MSFGVPRGEWLVEAVWQTSAAHIREVVSTRWPASVEALVKLVTQPGSADLRTRVEVRPVSGALASDVGLRWLEGLAERLRVAGSEPRVVDDGR